MTRSNISIFRKAFNRNSIIQPIFMRGKGYAYTGDLLKKGIHIRDIKKLRDTGTIIRIKRGFYRWGVLDFGSNQGFVDLSKAVPDGIICMLSALSYYEMTTFNPSVISMALRRGRRIPKIEYPPTDFYSFSGNIFRTGIDKINISGRVVKIYCIEKTICDCFRYRNKIGLDVAKEALTNYLKFPNKSFKKLLDYASICRVKPGLQTWLNVMV